MLSYGLSLSVDTQSLVTHSARVDAAQANSASVDLGLVWQEWQVAESARLETVRVGRLRRRLEVARAEIEFLEGTTQGLERALARGDTSLVRLGVRAQRSRRRQVRRELETAEAKSASSLLAQVGLAPEFALQVTVPEIASQGPRQPRLRARWQCLSRRLDLEALRTLRRRGSAPAPGQCSSGCPPSRWACRTSATRMKFASSAASELEPARLDRGQAQLRPRPLGRGSRVSSSPRSRLGANGRSSRRSRSATARSRAFAAGPGAARGFRARPANRRRRPRRVPDRAHGTVRAATHGRKSDSSAGRDRHASSLRRTPESLGERSS